MVSPSLGFYGILWQEQQVNNIYILDLGTNKDNRHTNYQAQAHPGMEYYYIGRYYRNLCTIQK